MRQPKTLNAKRVAVVGLLAASAVVVMFPVYAVVAMSFSSGAGFSTVLSPFEAGLTVDNYVEFMSATDSSGRLLFVHQLFNSLALSTATAGLSLLVASTAGYALSRFRFPGHRWGMASLVVTQMFPATMMIVPLFLLINFLGLLDSMIGLLLVYSTTSLPFCIYMLKGYFDTIPMAFDEAALLDGASRVRVFYQIVLPMARPALAVTGLFAFLTAWNEFILAATFLSKQESFTLPVALYRHVGAYGADWGLFAAGSVLVSIPVCVLFFVLQRHMVSGLGHGGVK